MTGDGPSDVMTVLFIIAAILALAWVGGHGNPFDTDLPTLRDKLIMVHRR